jgi:sugar phosphate isomerase/epimerase
VRTIPTPSLLVAALFGSLATAARSPAMTFPQTAPPHARDDRAAEALGWRLGTQAWTFRDRTAFEVVDVAKRLGLRYIEFFPGQALRPEQRDVKLGPEMAAADLAAFRKKLEESGVKVVSFGVVGFTQDEAAGRRLFEFGKALDLESFTAEPEPDALDLLERLAKEFSIKVAFHNHPKPSRYWSPDVVLQAVTGRSPLLGACADTGHWTRSGLVPVDCLKQLEGRVFQLHFKDLGEFGNPAALDVPWGTGKSDARGICAELLRQGFRGLISVEYENGAGAELEANVARCIAFFDRTARELAKP